MADFDTFAKRSPGFFAGRPVVVDISQMPASRPELVHMVTELKRRNVTIMGLDGRTPGELGADARGLPPILSGGKEIAALSQLADTIQASDIAKLAENAVAAVQGGDASTEAPDPETPAPETRGTDDGAAPADAEAAPPAQGAAATAVSAVTEAALAAVEKAIDAPDADTLIIDHPVRSGQSVVHLTGDVVVIGSVASGSEVVASGSIHIYGALRGRAIAGSAGNRTARIFTTQLNAELVAINGLYKTADDLDTKCVGRAVQAWLDGESLKMSAF
ncbi:septum site-determining protein MinC [Acuticoccus sp. I52.16.1]|uniref:septum site-determining protein MinC n=1 Tax=Acuticoccus sp. I52.16.1 TaxID=2928472 RepID=UPI001FD216E2|nr:septum site-determining protein MinC [Acuticoccus sp. I52.16.1]UOM32958.1 septum site-determining protein MinC [Acuticoccus sp. I52.16.1]